MFVHDYIRQHIYDTKGIDYKGPSMPTLEELKKTEWSNEFEKLMRNRLLMGAFRYKRLHESGSYDWITSIRQRLDCIEISGNAEHLIDIANICLVTFVRKDHPKFHFKAVDDGIHTSEYTT